jgi:predicted permease
VLAFMLIVATVTGVLAGMAPAFRATRPNIVGDLKAAKGERSGRKRWSGRDGLVIVQMAVTVVLLVTAGLLVRSLQAATRADVGFAADGLAIVSADTEMLRYAPERSKQYWDNVLRQIQSLPGVQHVALASRVPFSINFNRTNIAVPGRQKSPDEMGPSINSGQVSADYFATIGVDLLRGRTFTEADTPERPAVAVVSETMARAYWPGQDAIGQIVYERTLNSGRSFQIVGIVADHKLTSVSDPRLPVIYFARTQRPTGFNVVVARTTGSDVALVDEVRRVMVGLEPNLLVMESQTMRAQMQAMLFPVRVAAALVAVFSVLAMLLAAVGLYGIVAFTVAERTREIGIRMAIGARPREVLAVVMRQGVILAAIGLTIGFALGAVATRVVANALYGIGAADPVAWGVAAAALVVLTLAAHAVPAYRAMHLDPVRCLRTE